jgi:ATP-dependent Clp protease ATP-binding subunit ClpB
MTLPTSGRPAWLREFDLSLPITAQYILSGNVHDVHLIAGEARFVSTVRYLHRCLVENDYDLIYRFDPLEGIALDHVAEGVVSNDFFPDSHLGRATIGAVAKVADLMLQAATAPTLRVALIIEGASGLWADEISIDTARLMLVARRLAVRGVAHLGADPHESEGGRTVSRDSAVVWIADSENDAPDWLRRSDSSRTLRIPLPGLGARRDAAKVLLPSLSGWRELDEGTQRAAVDLFAETSQGVTFRGMRSIGALAHDQGIAPSKIDEAVRSHLLGVVDSPWADPLLLERIRDADERIQQRVLGQPHAVRRALDILLRSALGLTGAHHGRRVAGPQGILFFAGPTGVGKTELAKALAGVLFGAEDAYLRFDMSEFAAEHSEARLIGAPPGYIGHAAGGELTNAVRERPFSVLLFDEIEKAHPRILDKFLQILDDGRLTDGSGSTVYFSESLIVFTSNLGAAGADPRADPSVRQREILDEIHRHFTVALERPELLSRIGDNIIVFDSISPEVGERLAGRYLDAVVETVRLRRGVTVVLAPDLRDDLIAASLERLSFGGRGIASVVETALVNPLARVLASSGTARVIRVEGAERGPDGWRLTVRFP